MMLRPPPGKATVKRRPVATCAFCGCTDERACPGGCHWVEPDVCSACVKRARLAKVLAAAAGGDRDFDADIYELDGYSVKRAGHWKYFDRDSRRWCALPRLTTSVDDALGQILRGFIGTHTFKILLGSGAASVEVIEKGPRGGFRFNAIARDLALALAIVRVRLGEVSF